MHPSTTKPSASNSRFRVLCTDGSSSTTRIRFVSSGDWGLVTARSFSTVGSRFICAQHFFPIRVEPGHRVWTSYLPIASPRVILIHRGLGFVRRSLMVCNLDSSVCGYRSIARLLQRFHALPLDPMSGSLKIRFRQEDGEWP